MLSDPIVFRSLLAWCAAGRAGDPPLEALEQSPERFAMFAARNGLSGFFFRRLPEKRLPEALRLALRACYLAQWAQNEKSLLVTTRLTQLFLEAGLELIVLKGVLFEERYYGDIGQKSSCDIDLLLPQRGAFPLGDKLLREAGFVRHSKSLVGLRGAERFVHALMYTDGAATVDFHWTLRPHPSFRFNPEELRRGRQRHVLKGASFWILSPEHELLLQLLSIFTDLPYGSLRMKSLLDAYAVMRTVDPHLDWERFMDARREDGSLRIFVNVAELLVEYFEAHDQLPRLMAQLERHKPLRLRGTQLSLLAQHPGYWMNKAATAQNRLWALRLYDAALLTALFWEGLSTPMRFAIYDGGIPEPLRRIFRRLRGGGKG